MFLRKYGTLTVTGTTAIRIPIIKRGVVDFAVGADWTPAAGDVRIAIDGAAAANVTNLPVANAMGNTAYWEFVLTAAETTGKQIVVMVSDSATKAVEDQCFIVETYGHASAMYPVDLSAAQLPVNATHIGGTSQTGRDIGASVLLAANQDVRNVSGTLPAVTLAATQPNYAPAKAGDEMSLTSTVLAALFSDSDTSALVNAIIARVESDLDGADLSTAAIAVAVRNEILNRALSGNHDTTGTVGKILQFLDATISGRMAAGNVTVGGYASGQSPADSLSSTVTKVTSIDTLLTALTEVVSTVTRFKAAALSQAPTGSGSGGAGDAEQATSLEILEAVDSIAVALAGGSPVEPTGTTIFEHLEGIEDLVTNYISSVSAATDASATTIVGFPSTLNIGDSYTDDMSADIHIFLRDSNDDPITAVGTHDVTDPDFAPELTIAQDKQVGRVEANVTWVTASPEGYLKVEIPSSQSRRAAPGVAQMQLVLKWDGAEKALTKQAVTWVARV